jgi:hypothetical protein
MTDATDFDAEGEPVRKDELDLKERTSQSPEKKSWNSIFGSKYGENHNLIKTYSALKHTLPLFSDEIVKWIGIEQKPVTFARLFPHIIKINDNDFTKNL